MIPTETLPGAPRLTVEETGRLISQKGNPEETLANLVKLIQ